MRRLILSAAMMIFSLGAAELAEAGGRGGHGGNSWSGSNRRSADTRSFKGTRFNNNWAFRGRNHNHWTSWSWSASYSCWFYWCPSTAQYYYWYEPDGSYYPASNIAWATPTRLAPAPVAQNGSMNFPANSSNATDSPHVRLSP